jgi:hypothetical protein
MEIKENPSGRLIDILLSLKSQKKIIQRFLLTLIVISLVLVSGLSGIYYGTKLKYSTYTAIASSFYRYFSPSLSIPGNYIKGIFANPQVVKIHIKYMDYQRLAHGIENARKRGRITQEDKNVEVKATLEIGKIQYRTKLKLRGSYLDHARGDKWSFRIKVKKNTIFGMSRFSLSAPETRGHIHEWIYQKILKFNNLIGLRYRFVNVVLNGKDLGIYALEEFFDKRLVENNNLREGIILKPFRFEEDSNDVFVYRKKSILKSSEHKSSYQLANLLIKSFHSGKISAEKVFDLEKTAKYFAITEIFGGQHGHIDINFICYFNPITGLLEPIGYDSNLPRKISQYGGMITSPKSAYSINKTKGLKYLFHNKEFIKLYIQYLDELIKSNTIPMQITKMKSELNQNLAILYKEFPYFNYFKNNFLELNSKYIKKQISGQGYISVKLMSYDLAVGRINLQIDNIRDLPIEIIGVRSNNKLIFSANEETIVYPTDTTDRFPVRLFQVSEKVSIFESDKLELVYTVVGMPEKLYKEVNLSFKDDDLHSYVDGEYTSRKHENFKQFDFIEKIGNILKIRKGYYTFDKDLVIPKGYTFILESGVEIDLTSFAGITSYSPLNFLGTADNPVKIYSSDSKGQGILVINAEGRSIITHTLATNLSAHNSNGWTLKGAINFYKSGVDFKNFTCTNNRASDDCLNIINSRFTINDSLFSNTYADALDTDFSKGEIKNTSFLNSGNDGIDTSGSTIKINNVRIISAKDKCISVGENSEVFLNKVNLSGCNIGIASKDLSSVNGNDIELTSSKTGISIFQKKWEFGPAEVKLKNIKFSNIKKPWSIGPGSSLIIDDREIVMH